MSSRQFTKLSPALWRSARFNSLADASAQLLHVYYLTSEHQTSAGAFRLPDGYALDDLAWPKPVYIEARAKLTEAGLILHDEAAREFYIPRWFKHSPVINPNHIISVRRRISELESDAIREAAEAECESAVEVYEAGKRVVPLHSGIENTRLYKGGRA